MKYIVRSIKYCIRQIRISFFHYSPSYFWEVDKKPPFMVRFLQTILGYFYYQFKQKQERFRVWYFNREQDLVQSRIFFEIIKFSSKLLWYLFILLLLSTFFDWTLFYHIKLRSISFPTTHLAEVILGAIVASISAILGLLFALYSVGFLLNTEKYSHKVTEYMDDEKFGNFYFKLLIFTDLFSLIILFIILLTEKVALISLAISFLLFLASLIGIVVFKNSYLLSLKPLSIYRRLTFDVLLMFKNINCLDNPRVQNFKFIKNKNIKSLKLYFNFMISWSVVKNSQINTNRLLDISKTLFRDLSKATKYDDAYYGLSFSSNILQKYISIKRYIDTNRFWWFPEQYEYVKASNRIMYTFKANYEIRGVGPLFIQKPNLNWFEDTLINFFKEVQDNHIYLDKQEKKKNNIMISSLIDAYGLLLAGGSKKDKEGRYFKSDLGSFENQEFNVFDLVLTQFFALYDVVKDNESLYIDYLNALFQTSLVVIEGFAFEKLSPFIKQLISNSGQLGVTRDEVRSFQLPKIALEIIIDFWERLEVEQIAEGKIITPLSWLEESIKQEYDSKTKKVVENYIKKIIQHTDEILKDLNTRKDFVHLAQIVKIRYEWISRLLYLNNISLAEHVSSLIKNNIIYLLYLPTKEIDDSELREQIEKGLLPSIVIRNKPLYKFYLSAFLLTLAHLINKEGQSEREKIMLMRVPLLVGSLAFLVSELDIDSFYVTEFITQAETLLFKKELLVEILDQTDKITKYINRGELFLLIENESNRYRYYYRIIINSIQNLPEAWVHESPNAIGYGRTVKHPSKIIQRAGSFQFYDMDQANEDFVEWVKKRDVIKKLVFIINNIPNDKTK